MSILSLKDISKSFSGINVLSNINFELRKGEFFSIVGPSGCGKTTLLRIIAGLEFPSTGEIFIEDKNVTDQIPQKRKTGIVFQNYALFPNMSVFQNVAYGLEVKKEDKERIKEKVFEVLEKVKMKDKAGKNVTTLSGGEQQRVSLARVIVTEPALLLFDEPLSNLDYALRLETRNEIKRLQKDLGITSVYVTHDQSEALALSDRIAVLDTGVIRQIGSPNEIYFNPQNYFVADFIGHSNFFDKKTSSELFNINDLKDDELLSVFPEEIVPERCSENCKAVIADIQFTGLVTEYLIECGGKIIRSIVFPNSSDNRFQQGDKVNLLIKNKVNRRIKNEFT